MKLSHLARPFLIVVAGCSGRELLVEPLAVEEIGSADARSGVVVEGAEKVVLAHARALSARDPRALADLLDRDFRYCVPPSEIADYPWMSGACWNGRNELRMIGNMSDPDYSGDEPPVQSIDANYLITSMTQGDGAVIVGVSATIIVFVSPDSGWLTDTRFEFELVDRGRGSFRIAEIREIGFLGREETSWAAIKNLYRP